MYDDPVVITRIYTHEVVTHFFPAKARLPQMKPQQPLPEEVVYDTWFIPYVFRAGEYNNFHHLTFIQLAVFTVTMLYYCFT